MERYFYLSSFFGGTFNFYLSSFFGDYFYFYLVTFLEYLLQHWSLDQYFCIEQNAGQLERRRYRFSRKQK